MNGWRPEPDPPPGVPDHLVGTIHAPTPGCYKFAVAAAQLETLGPVVLELEVDAPTPAAAGSDAFGLGRLNAELSAMFQEQLVERINRDCWGMRMLSTHHYNGPWDDGDEDRGLAHDRAVLMSELVECALGDVPQEYAFRGSAGRRRAAAARLRIADYHETEAALARALERED